MTTTDRSSPAPTSKGSAVMRRLLMWLAVLALVLLAGAGLFMTMAGAR